MPFMPETEFDPARSQHIITSIAIVIMASPSSSSSPCPSVSLSPAGAITVNGLPHPHHYHQDQDSRYPGQFSGHGQGSSGCMERQTERCTKPRFLPRQIGPQRHSVMSRATPQYSILRPLPNRFILFGLLHHLQGCTGYRAGWSGCGFGFRMQDFGRDLSDASPNNAKS